MTNTRFHLLTDPRDAFNRYSHLTYPSFRFLLNNVSANGPILAFAVTIDNFSAGLALAQIRVSPTGLPNARIYSLFIAAEHRGIGLGRQLLQRFETEIGQHECTELHLEYVSDINNLTLERMLIKNCWTIQNVGVICYASRSKVLAAKSPHLLDSLDNLQKKLPADCHLFFWNEISQTERSELEDRVRRDPNYQRYTPFIDEDFIEPMNSLGLRYKGSVVGWVITHRIAPNTVRYTRLFADPDHQPSSRGMYLLTKSIQLHFDSCCVSEDAFATWEFNPDNDRMMRLVQRRLKPYLSDIKNACVAVKSIKQ